MEKGITAKTSSKGNNDDSNSNIAIATTTAKTARNITMGYEILEVESTHILSLQKYIYV